MKRKGAGITLIEAIIAMWILFIAICFIFEVLRTSYTQVNKMKMMSQLASLGSSKLEHILYENSASDIDWTPFPEAPDFQYKITTSYTTIDDAFPSYKVKQVTIDTKGPVGRRNIQEFHLSMGTILLDNTQTVVTTEDAEWGGGMSPEACSR
ncbi:MAG: hypothetical protein AB9903_34770 [Vulcanimicrobiota bacterium]